MLVVGWSLGGLFARELARAFPEQVQAVVTLGSPFSGDPRQNNVWRLYERIAGHQVDQPPIPRITEKPPVPHLAIWSRRDGIVAWPACIDRVSPLAEHVEVRSTHVGMGIDPDVWAVVAERLHRPV